MTPPQAPEWLEPSHDAKSHRKARRRLPVLALSAAFTLIGAGAIFAQPQEVTAANTTASVAVLNTAQLDSSVTPPILNFPAVATLSEDDEDLFDFYGFYGFDEDDFDEDEDEDDFDDDDEEDDDDDEEDDDDDEEDDD